MTKRKNNKKDLVEQVIAACEDTVHTPIEQEEVVSVEETQIYTAQESINVEVTVEVEGSVATRIEKDSSNELVVSETSVGEISEEKEIVVVADTSEQKTEVVSKVEEIVPLQNVVGIEENFDINGKPVEIDEDLPHEFKGGFTEEIPTLATISSGEYSMDEFGYIPQAVEQDVAPMPSELEDPVIAPMQVSLTQEEVEEANRANNPEPTQNNENNGIPEVQLPELLIVPLEEENQPYQQDPSHSGEISSAMQEDEDIVVVAESEERKPKMKIKEIKYGMTVIANLGNYENIRTHIEATAEIETNEDLVPSIKELSSHIRKIGREEYRVIKEKTIAKEKKAQQEQKSRIHTGNASQLGNPQQPNQQPQTQHPSQQQPRGSSNPAPRNSQPQYPPAQHGQRTQKAAPTYNQNQPFHPNQRY